MIKFKNNIEGYILKSKELWWNSSNTYELEGNRISIQEKIINEKKTNIFIDQLFYKLSNFPNDKINQDLWKEEINGDLIKFFKEIEIVGNELEENFLNSLLRIFSEFIKDIRAFDPNLNMDNINQAIRNLGIMLIIKWVFGMEITYSRAMFAYCLLYPYSDNFIDDTDITYQDKRNISKHFREKIQGKLMIGEYTSCEMVLFELIDVIEKDFEREKYDNVYESLLAIHKGQEKSIEQQGKIYGPYEKDILGISLEKGGTSVLADGYLVAGELDHKQELFTFLFGVILQFCDDLEDVNEDIENKSSTIFSQTANTWKLDEITNKVFNLLTILVESNKDFVYDPGINNFIFNNIKFMLIAGISKNIKMYSKEYIEKVSWVSIYRLPYIEKLRKKINKKCKNFKTINGLGIEEVLAQLHH